MQCDNFVEEESVEETIDGQLPAPPPSTGGGEAAVRRGFLNRTPEPPAPRRRT